MKECPDALGWCWSGQYLELGKPVRAGGGSTAHLHHTSKRKDRRRLLRLLRSVSSVSHPARGHSISSYFAASCLFPGQWVHTRKRGHRISHLIEMLFLYWCRPRWNEPALEMADLAPDRVNDTRGLSSFSLIVNMSKTRGFIIGRLRAAHLGTNGATPLWLKHTNMFDAAWKGDRRWRCTYDS